MRVAGWLVPDRNPAGSVYGLVAIGALLAAESGQHEGYLDTVLSVVIAALTYWLLHAYSTALGGRIARGERLTMRTVAAALRHERTLLRGAAVPVLTLLVAWISGSGLETGVSAALWTAVACLIAFEVLAGVRADSSPRELVLEATVGLTLGVSVVLVRLVLHH